MQKTDMEFGYLDKSGSDAPPYRVGVVALPGFAMMSYACTVEPLRAANLLSRRRLYEISHFSADQVTQCSGDAQVPRSHEIGEQPDLDLLLVVAGGDPFTFDDPEVLSWLGDMSERVPRIGGVSGGSVILTKAGLMSGRRMTVHWEHAAELAETYPDVLIERRLFVIDRDRVTCGGGTAPLDMMHALIAGQHGGVFAGLVSDWFLHTDIRAAAAPQRALPSTRLGPVSDHVVEAVAAMENHVADPLTVSQLSLIVGISPRHLNRLFQETFGKSVMTFYRHLRLDIGRRLVTTSRMQIADIANATGFSTAAHFSNQYREVFDIRPVAERQSFSAHPN